MTPERLHQLDEVLLKIAESIGTMSLATRAKVGAILFKDGNIISMGWNGMPSGMPNDQIEIIHEDGSVTTNPFVLHGESNAILKCAASKGNARGSTLYCTYSPCPDCTKLIIQAGIKRVVYRQDYRLAEGIPILKQIGIQVEKLDG